MSLLWRLGRTAPALVAIRTLFGFFEAVGLALDGNDFGAVHEPIDERNDAAGVWEHFLPLREWFIGGDDRALFLVAPVEQFKEQVRVTIRVGQIADLGELC
jgi:hypothetical protein